eukprot:m.20851 g.20851  ORF g.20851 m.20851 type:complete len:319 (+) comp6290_c1_seq1:60-1016(+)
MSFNDSPSTRRDYLEPVSLEQQRYTAQRLLTALQTNVRTLGGHCAQLQRKCQEGCSLRTIQEDERLITGEEREMRSLMVQLHRLKCSVSERDHAALDAMIQPVFDEYQRVLQTLQRTRSAVAARVDQLRRPVEPLGDFEVINTVDTPQRIVLEDGTQLTRLEVEDDQHHETAHEMELLAQDAVELNEMMTDLLKELGDQREALFQVEDGMDDAAVNTHKATEQLIKSNRLKAASYPMAGALIGGAILGPVGLAAGFKLGAAFTAMIGMGLGSATGKVVSAKLNEKIDKDDAVHRDNADASLLPHPKPDSALHRRHKFD